MLGVDLFQIAISATRNLSVMTSDCLDMCLHHPKRCNFLSCQIQGLMEQLAGTEICVGLLSVATLWRSNEITC